MSDWGVFSYATPNGYTFLDRELYLPKSWTDDPARCQQAGVPAGVEFATKPHLGRRMLQRLFETQVPCAWVSGDEVYGSDHLLRLWLETQGQAYVLAVSIKEPLWIGYQQYRADQVAANLATTDWVRLSCEDGTKGPREYDWARVAFNCPTTPDWQRWLLASKEQQEQTDGLIRQPGGGQKRIEEKDPSVLQALESLLEPMSRGDPQSLLRWTCKSVTKLAEQLRAMGHPICPKTVHTLLRSMGYSLQSNLKRHEGGEHPDRDKQFQHIARRVTQFQQCHRPVISVDTKKKELVGNFKNAGQEWQPEKQPVAVNVYDFKDDELGKVIPYGVYDLSFNQGWVSVGIDHDTAEFAVESIRHWWYQMGQPLYPRSEGCKISEILEFGLQPRVNPTDC